MLEFANVSFSYDQKPVLTDFSMTLARGEILSLMGASGRGKTTILSLAAGLLRPQKGTLVSNAERVVYVFQEPRLLPWCTVSENLAAVLEDPKKDDARIREVLKKVGLSDAADLYPHALSGGMKSRVSLARAMLYGGDLYLLDEPFAALDEDTKNTLSDVLKEHIRAMGASAILVTHNENDARRMADRILQLNDL